MKIKRAQTLDMTDILGRVKMYADPAKETEFYSPYENDRELSDKFYKAVEQRAREQGFTLEEVEEIKVVCVMSKV